MEDRDLSKATFDQYLQIGALIKGGTLDRQMLQAIIEGRVIVKPDATAYRGNLPGGERNLITVQDLPANELAKLAEKQLGLTYLDGDLAKWDFITDERGRSYEVQSWKPGREVVPATEVREHFTNGFVGNTAAFVALMMRDNPEGYHASIPAYGRLFQRGDSLCAPNFLRAESNRKLCLTGDVRSGWNVCLCFWAFREVQA